MRRNFLLAVMALTACAGLTHAQTGGAGVRAEQETSASRAGRGLDIASGTRLTAQLQSTLDVRRARVGDEVVLKTTEAVRVGGETVVRKGAKLFGRVAAVERHARGGAESSVTLLFDRLESGSLKTPISVTVDSVTRAGARARASDEDLGAGASASGRAQGGASAGGGGLLGGVTGAVGQTVGGVTNAAGGVLGSTTETVNSTTRALGQVRVSQSLGATAEGGSTLSLAGDNLRLEKGTTFRLTVQESARFNDQ